MRNLLLGLGFALLATVPALANPYSYSSESEIGSQSVTINYVSPSGPGGASSLNVYAGEFALGGFVDNGKSLGTLDTFCYDIYDYIIQSNGSFTTKTVLTGTQANHLDALLVNGEKLIGGSDSNAAAALQVAIWETEYTATVATFSASTAVMSDVTTFLHNVNTGAWQANPNTEVVEYSAPGSNQGQITLTNVPEPASLVLLGSGLLGLLHVRSRRSSDASTMS